MGRRACILFASMALALVLGSGVAFAHPLQFESDLSENGKINFCNPEQLRPVLFQEAISDWNSYAADNSLPRIVNVTDNPDAFCELRADAQGGDLAGYYARVVFAVHPDNLDISTSFNDLSLAQKGATLRHELGHAAVGLDHNHLCSSSVMAPLRYCIDNGTPRRATVGPHDVADRDDYWNAATSIYPIHDKCWTNADADGDGVCDLHGIPEILSLSSISDQPVWAPPAEEN